MALVEYIDVASVFVQGIVVDGNNRQVLVVEVSNSEDDKVVLMLRGGMAHALKQTLDTHVQGLTREERDEIEYNKTKSD